MANLNVLTKPAQWNLNELKEIIYKRKKILNIKKVILLFGKIYTKPKICQGKFASKSMRTNCAILFSAWQAHGAIIAKKEIPITDALPNPSGNDLLHFHFYSTPNQMQQLLHKGAALLPNSQRARNPLVRGRASRKAESKKHGLPTWLLVAAAAHKMCALS